LEQLGINLGFIIVQVVNFILIFIVLRKWAFIPIANVLETRREKVAQGLEDARVAAEARENAEAEAEKIIAEAQAKASETVREATTRAEEATRDIKAAAEKEAAGARQAALEEVEAERNAVLGEVRGQIAALAMAATQKLVGATLDEKRQRGLIDEFFSGVKDGKVVVVEPVEGDSAVVTTALPLTNSEQKTLKTNVLKGKGEVEFKVDPAILGGLVVRVGDKVLDGSVAGKLDSMRQNLK
jgi:F-type H+-transporting ATPase subunit b